MQEHLQQEANGMIIRNGMVFRKNGIFEKADVQLQNGVITGIFPCGDSFDEEILDAAGKYVVPGFVDIHLHGAAGHDFCEGTMESLEEIARFERACGVTAFCPASMTLPEDELKHIFEVAGYVTAERKKMSAGEFKSLRQARILGIHMEGPYLSGKRCGAQKKAYLQQPDGKCFQELQEISGGNIRIVTLAPELPGAMEMIHEIKNKNPGTVCSIGHSDADYETALEAFEAGADHVTHLYNAMPPFLHREPGIVGAALDRPDVMVELICDGNHLHPATIRATFQMSGDDRVCLISDSMEATGMPDGEYALGGQKVYKQGRTARLADGTLAGSVSSLYDCFQEALKAGIKPETALKAVTCNPARSIGAEGLVGALEAGMQGDILILDEEWKLERVI